MLLTFLVTGITLGMRAGNGDPFFMLLVFLAATLGSTVNQTLDKEPESIGSLSLYDGLIYFAWKILVAIVFALFLYCLFMSGIVSGDLIPEFFKSDKPYTGVIDFLNNTAPKNYDDAAKMLVWAFLAGYSERFVPNIIHKLLAKAGNV